MSPNPDIHHPSSARLPLALTDSIGFLLSKSAELLRGKFNDRLKAHGITARQVGVLAVVSALGGATQRGIADALRVDQTTMMKLIDGLEALGAVERTETRDRRSYAVVITEKGELLRERALAEARRVERDVLRRVPLQDRETLRRVLRALVTEE